MCSKAVVVYELHGTRQLDAVEANGGWTERTIEPVDSLINCSHPARLSATLKEQQTLQAYHITRGN